MRYSWRIFQPSQNLPARNTRTRCEICSKLTIKTQERPQRKGPTYLNKPEAIDFSVYNYLLVRSNDNLITYFINYWCYIAVSKPSNICDKSHHFLVCLLNQLDSSENGVHAMSFLVYFCKSYSISMDNFREI